jgi:hypothetical protein
VLNLTFVVNGVGNLFEHWLVSAGSWLTRQYMKKQHLNMPLDNEQRADIIKREGPKWFFSVITGLHNRGKKCSLQLFYLTMLLQFRGLSKNASNLTSHMGFTLVKRTYGRYEEAYLAEMQWELRLVEFTLLELHVRSRCL